jgi:hypothetical protein
MIVESRLERYRNRKKLAFLRFVKLIVIFSLIAILIVLLMRVNKTIIDLNVLENTDLLLLDIYNKTLTIFGKTYYITK